MNVNYYNVGDQIYFANHESVDLDIITSLGNGTATAGNSFMITPTQCGDITFTIVNMGSGTISISCSDPIIHPNSPCTDGCGVEGNNPDLKIFASGYVENSLYDVTTISSVWEDPDGVVVYDEILQVNSQGQFNNEFDNPMYVRDMRDTGMYTTTYTYDDVVLEYQWSYTSYIYEPEDTVPPVVVVPNDMAIQATSNNPSPVTFSVSVTDDTDGTLSPTCSPSSGSNFSIGVTTVTCTATDAAGNQSSESFTITVSYDEPEPTYDDFTVIVEEGTDIPGVGTALQIKVFNAAQTVSINISSADGTLVESLEFVASSQGEINQPWVIPQDLESGMYTVSARDAFDSDCIRFNSETFETDENCTIQSPEPEPESISVRTSRSSYDEGDTIVIIGSLSPSLDNAIVSIEILDNDLGDIVFSRQVSTESDGDFTTTISTNELQTSDFTVIATYQNLVGDYYFEIESEPQPDPEPEPNEVTITTAIGSGAPGCEETADGCYIPTTVRVAAGGVVIMENDDTAAHTFTSGTPDGGPDGIFDTSLMMKGQSFEWSPEQEGDYPYFCMVHPWMIGEIIVGKGGDTPIPVKINVKTDRNSYHIGDDVKITGVVRPSDGSSVILEIFSPSGDLILNERVRPSSNGAFTEEIKLTGSDYRDTGSYVVKAISKSASDKVEFLVKSGTPDDIPKHDPTEILDEVTIVPVDYSGAPGCEDTAIGCYDPSIVSVSVGGVVIMSNTDTAAHTFTSGTPDGGPDGVFDTSLLMAGSSYEWSPRNEGEQPYFCMVHPWMTGIILVGEGTTRPTPEPEPKDHVDLEIQIENRVYDINTVAVLDISLSGTNESKNVAIEVTDPRGTTVITRSAQVDSDGLSFEFKIDENFKTGNYKVTATTSDNNRTVHDTTHFKVKSQFNSFKITSVQVTDQKGNASSLEAGDIGFIKVVLSSNKSIATLMTVNIFDAELTSIGIGSVNTTLSSGESEIILSFNIPDDAAIGPADIYVNAFSDWPSSGGVPLTGEVSIVEDIE